MNILKKILVTSIPLFTSIGAAQAAVTNYNFTGEFAIYDTSCCVVAINNVDGLIAMDWVSGVGTASVWNNGTPGFRGDTDLLGLPWTAHNFSLQATGPSSVHVDFMFDWNNNNIHAAMDWLMTPNGSGGYSVTSLDGNSNSYPGIAMDNGPFAGWDVSIAGTASVPIPASAWLLGSGFLGLIGVVRRKAA
jgi:hypothetical protein